MKTCVALFFCGIIAVAGAGCGSSGSGSSSSGGGSSGGSGGGSSEGFQITGTVQAPTIGISSNVLKGISTSGTVTHVMAVSPETGNTACKIAALGSDNTFTLGITGKKPWLFFFLDQSKLGAKMFLGRFRSSGLDTLPPAATSGTLNLSTVSIDSATGIASSSKEHATIISDLGLGSDTADTIGTIDDVATRYENPDIDGDGAVDCNDSSKQFILDFHIRYNMQVNGQNVTVSDIINAYMSDSAVASYTDTGIYVSYPSSFSSVDTGSVTFTNSTVILSSGTLSAGTATTNVTSNNFSSYKGFGPNLVSTSEFPNGEIIFAFGGKTLTFSNVQTPTLAKIAAPTGRLFPFIRFNTSDANCTTNCTLGSIGYKWMKKTVSGWTAASEAEMTLLVADAALSLRVDNNSSKVVVFTIPKTSLEGTVTWSSANASLEGVTAAELTNLITTQLCHIGLSYDDQLGMRYFEGIQNAAGTCS